MGIIGSNLTVINSGAISGGLKGSGPARANAITFTAGTNLLELQAGYSFLGKVVAVANGTDVLALGGDNNPVSPFDVSQVGPAGEFQNFASFEKTGASTWSLSGMPGQVMPWTPTQGTLLVSQAGSLGTGALTFNGGTLQFGVGYTVAGPVVINSRSIQPSQTEWETA